MTGYVHNGSFYLIERVKVHVKVQDGAGRVVSEADGVVSGDIPAFGRGAFDIAVKTLGARYEVQVVSLERPQVMGGAD